MLLPLAPVVADDVLEPASERICRGAGKTGRRNRAILWCLIAVTNPLSSNFPSCRSGLSHITAFTMLCPRIPICDVQTCIPYPQIAMSIGKLLINHQNYSKLGQLGDIGRYWDCSHSIFKYIKHDFKKKHMFNVFDAEPWPGALPGTPGA